jgi:hypothetical protein
MSKKSSGGKYYVIFEGLTELNMDEERYNTYEEALTSAKEMAEEGCMNYTIVQEVAEVQFKTSVRVRVY